MPACTDVTRQEAFNRSMADCKPKTNGRTQAVVSHTTETKKKWTCLVLSIRSLAFS